MHTAQAGRTAKRNPRKGQAFPVKHWWRGFVYAWVAMLLGAALLPCGQAVAAAVAPAQELRAECGAPAAGDTQKPGTRVTADVPASASNARLAGNPALPSPIVSVPFHFTPPLPALARARASRTAPPPVAVCLRSSRLLI